MNQVTITLPMPHPDLSPNSRCHWARKSTRKRNQRELARVFLIEWTRHFPEPWDEADVCIEVVPPDRRRRDRDNLLASLKSAFDGAQDAGLIRDDSGLTYLPVMFLAPDKLNAGVTLTFTQTK